jgi:hypothetical protein
VVFYTHLIDTEVTEDGLTAADFRSRLVGYWTDRVADLIKGSDREKDSGVVLGRVTIKKIVPDLFLKNTKNIFLQVEGLKLGDTDTVKSVSDDGDKDDLLSQDIDKSSALQKKGGSKSVK